MVQLDVYMLGMWAHLWQYGNLQRAHVILKTSTANVRSLAVNVVTLIANICHQLYERYQLPQISREGNVLCLSIDEADQSLKF